MEKFNEDDGVWRTISGRRVFIREGESVESAMSRSGKFSRVQKNKDKYDTIDKYKKRKATNKFEEEPTPKKKEKLRLIKDKDNRYIVSRGDDDEEAIENYKKKYGDYDEKKEVEGPSRREKLLKFAQENKDLIKKYGEEYDEETNRRAFEKAKRGEGLTAKEYFGFIGSEFKPGSVILEQFADGENAVVAKDGNWIRESRVKAYNENPRANQDAIYDDEKESNLKWEQDEKEHPLISVEEMRKKYANQKNPFRDDEFVRKELEKEKINRFKEQKQSNVKVKEGSPIEDLISKEGINVGGRLREIDNETISIFKALKDRNANDQMAKFILHSKYYDSNEDNLLDKYKEWLKKNK